MAKRIAPTRIDADNSSGSLPAACTDWRTVSRFHVGTGHREPTPDAGHTTACAFQLPNLSFSFLDFRGSPYMKGYAFDATGCRNGVKTFVTASISNTNITSAINIAVGTTNKAA